MTTTTDIVRVPLRIAGAAADPASGRYFDKIRRLTGETVATVAAAGRADAERAVDAAAKAAPGWAATPPAQRRQDTGVRGDASDRAQP